MTPEEKSLAMAARQQRYQEMQNERIEAKKSKKSSQNGSSVQSTEQGANSSSEANTSETLVSEQPVEQIENHAAPSLDPDPDNAPKVENVGGGQSDFKPFGEDPVSRSYTKPQSTIKPGSSIPDIPEPVFNPNVVVPPSNAVKEEKKPINPALANASAEERHDGAVRIADLMLSGYDLLHRGGRWMVKTNPEKLSKLALDGKIDLGRFVPTNKGDGSTIQIGELFNSYNEGVDEALTLSPKFVAKIREPLIRVCEKRGWGATDEQTVMLYLAEDLATKISLGAAMKMTSKGMLDAFLKMHSDEKKAKNSPPKPIPRKDDTLHVAEIIEPEENDNK